MPDSSLTLTTNSSPSTNQKIRVLYVDDERDLLKIGKIFLENTGKFSVDTLESAEEALHLPHLNQYDAIVSDFQMLRMNGIEFLRIVREKFGEIPFILLTGRGREEIVIQAINHGADFYLQKGGDVVSLYAELTDRILYAVSRRRATQDLERRNFELQAAYEQIAATEEELRSNLEELSRQENLLKVSETRLMMAEEISQTGCWEYTPNSDLIWCSEQMKRIFGLLSVSCEISLSRLNACIPDKDSINRSMSDLIENGIPYNLEYLIRPEDGSPEKIVHSVARLERDPLSGRVWILGSIQDITTLKAGERALAESEARFRGFFTYSPVGINIFDQEGKVIGVNKVAREYFGVSEDDPLSGYRLFEDPSITDETKNRLKNGLMATEERYIDFTAIRLHKMYASTKSKIDRVFIQLTFAPYGPDLKNPIGYIAVIQDLSKRKQTGDALIASESHLHTLLQTIPDLVWLKDTNGVFLNCNTMFSRFLGADEQEIIGKTDYDFLSAEMAEFFRENDARAVVAGHPVRNEEWITFADDGHRALLETIKTPMFETHAGILSECSESVVILQDEENRKTGFRKLMHILRTLSPMRMSRSLYGIQNIRLPGSIMPVNF
ncbi:MAG: PAS domain S-box protein [Methanospirillum sp.]|uniref:PAS domain S-box protein n=1 Tax=Methanospirillum sp. TaxID=45200 RepID=UPI0023750168|nr:PAS domain S-box protein [Methanospirillum sp.]MDD1730368.1 PAS domain S-box protein [Methanospirillum sp.]